MPLVEGTRFGLYEIGGLIGAGGMGEVYRARDTKLNREVATKVLPAKLAAEAGVEVLSSHLMEGNPGRVQVFAGLEEPLDRLADLERCRSRNTSGPAVGTEQRAHVLDIRVKAIPLEV